MPGEPSWYIRVEYNDTPEAGVPFAWVHVSAAVGRRVEEARFGVPVGRVLRDDAWVDVEVFPLN